MRAAGARTEPYPDVVLPVVSLLEFLRRVGKSLQSKGERRNEPRESKRTQALPTPAQEHGCCPNTQHRCLGVRAAPCHPRAALAREQEEALWAAPWKGAPGPGSQCFLLAPAFPGASQYPQRNFCHLSSTGLSHCSLAAVGIPLEQGRLLLHGARAEPRSLY